MKIKKRKVTIYALPAKEYVERIHPLSYDEERCASQYVKEHSNPCRQKSDCVE